MAIIAKCHTPSFLPETVSVNILLRVCSIGREILWFFGFLFFAQSMKMMKNARNMHIP
jgi:hypothetical protein